MAHLLTAEDDAIGGAIESSLRAHGHQVPWGHSGREALRVAALTEFDLVDLDLDLDLDLDGHGAASTRWRCGRGKR